MKALTISEGETMILALQDEIRRNDQSRYDHRLHGVLLVAQGMSCRKAAALLGDAPRTVENWVNGFEREGFGALTEHNGRGRKSRLNEVHLEEIEKWLRRSPKEYGLEGNLWDGKTLSACIEKKFCINLQIRQCQRLFRQLGFRYRLPRPTVAKADPVRQSAHKKTRNSRKRP
jgi:transposase